MRTLWADLIKVIHCVYLDQHYELIMVDQRRRLCVLSVKNDTKIFICVITHSEEVLQIMTE